MIEVFSVVWVSGFGSYTLTIAEAFTNDLGTVIVVPEVV
jgi:hypothetical protein